MAAVFNIAKGKVAQLAALPAANDAIIVIPLETAGIEPDGTLQDYANVQALLAGPSNEQTTLGRKTATGVTVNVDNVNNRVDVDCNDIVWSAAAGNAVSKILFAYDPDTTSGTDADLIPLVVDDFVASPSGGDLTYQVNASGFFRAS